MTVQAKKKNIQSLPPLFQSDDPVLLLDLFRVLWIRGRYGGGKTSLGVWLTHELLQRNRARHVVSNITLTMQHVQLIKTLTQKQLIRELTALYELAAESDISELDSEFVDCVFLLDEAWALFSDDAPPQLRNALMAYPRKLNQYLILPSFRRLHKSVWQFTIARALNFRAATGLPLWWYALETRDGEETVKTSFWWWRPERAFRLYDTSAVPSDTYYIYRYAPHRANAKIKKERDKLNVAAFSTNFFLLLCGLYILYFAFSVLNAPVSSSPSITSDVYNLYLPLILAQ